MDRVNINEGKPQIFGTQFFVNKNNKFIPKPIQYKKNLAKRRKDFGLPPFHEYKKFLLKRHKIYK